VKEPDFAFVPLGPGGVRRDFPSIVMEAGWATTGALMQRDRRQWHEGSGGEVMVVILVKLFRLGAQDRVRVTLEVSHTAPKTKVKITRRVYFFPFPIQIGHLLKYPRIYFRFRRTLNLIQVFV